MKNRARRAQAWVRRHPTAADMALAAALAVAALVSAKALYDLIGDDPEFSRPSSVVIVLCMLGLTLPLTWRRRFPFSVGLIVIGAFLVGRIAFESRESSMTLLSGSLAIYSVAAHGRQGGRTLVLGLCVAGVMGEVVREILFVPSAADLRPLLQTFTLAYNAVILALPWLLGTAVRSSRARERELADRAAELQREREENARQAVFAERVRIARELHDVVAHHVSMMGVQAGAARRVMERQPAKAVEALSSIESSSRQAVVEMHRLLGYLRRAGEADELAPQPGLAQLGDLVADAAQADLAVDLSIEGDPRTLSPTLEVSAYRVIQEALTNARKHSGGATATVRVRYGAETLDVEVLDDGRSAPGSAPGEGGHGLIGMRERASLHGGHFRAGPRPEGGFGVHASFPLTEPVLPQ